MSRQLNRCPLIVYCFSLHFYIAYSFICHTNQQLFCIILIKNITSKLLPETASPVRLPPHTVNIPSGWMSVMYTVFSYNYCRFQLPLYVTLASSYCLCFAKKCQPSCHTTKLVYIIYTQTVFHGWDFTSFGQTSFGQVRQKPSIDAEQQQSCKNTSLWKLQTYNLITGDMDQFTCADQETGYCVHEVWPRIRSIKYYWQLTNISHKK